MPVLNYRQKTPTVEAIQWFKNNSVEVLDWLGTLSIEYSYDEILSGGELIVYSQGPAGGPNQIEESQWLAKTPTRFMIINDVSFEANYEEV